MYPRYLILVRDFESQKIIYSKRFKSIHNAIVFSSGFYADTVDIECTDLVFDRSVEIESLIAEFKECYD